MLKMYMFLPPDFTTISADIIRASDVFCLCSRFEGFGLVALESMSAARPVIISKVAGIATHVEKAECGITVDPNVDSVVEALQWMYSHKKQLDVMGYKGRNYASNNLSSKKITECISREYSKVLNKSHELPTTL